MLEPKAENRPTIWQVCEVAFRISGRHNPVQNVFVSRTCTHTVHLYLYLTLASHTCMYMCMHVYMYEQVVKR